MNALVIYDSQFGNTEKIALAIAEGVSTSGSQCTAKRIKDTTSDDLKTIDSLIVGSPTQGGRATKSVSDFIASLPKDALQEKKIAAFDTRFYSAEKGAGLRFLMKLINYAAGKMAKALISKGGTQIIEPEGFFVTDKEGPIKEGELERAKEWGRNLQAV